MSTTTMSKPPAGQQVRITAMPGGAHTGKIGTVSDAYTDLTPNQIAVVINDGASAPPSHQNGCWIVDGWEPVLPAVGDKVIPLPDDGNWYGIPEEYRTVVGTVTEMASENDATGRRWVAAEFPSRQKPDDTIRWSFYWCKPADGHTLTVSSAYRPTVGDKVTITGYLSDSDIVDGLNLEGTVQSVEGDIWMVHTPSLGHVASGPGYVTAIEPKIAVLETDVEPEQTYTKAQYDAIVRERDNLRTRCQQYADDFNLMGELLLDEANRRNWCGEYDEFVDNVNGKLGILQLPERETEYEVEVEVTGTISYTTTVTVTARSQEDADEMVSDDISSYVDGDDILTDAARHLSFDNIEMEVV